MNFRFIFVLFKKHISKPLRNNLPIWYINIVFIIPQAIFRLMHSKNEAMRWHRGLRRRLRRRHILCHYICNSKTASSTPKNFGQRRIRRQHERSLGKRLEREALFPTHRTHRWATSPHRRRRRGRGAAEFKAVGAFTARYVCCEENFRRAGHWGLSVRNAKSWRVQKRRYSNDQSVLADKRR